MVRVRTGCQAGPADLPSTIASDDLFDNVAERLSFYARVTKVLPLTRYRKYRKYVDRERGPLHIALVAAVATVAFSSDDTPRVLRVAFDVEFRRQLAASISGKTSRP